MSRPSSSEVRRVLVDGSASAMDCPCHVAICRVERFQGRATGEFDPFKVKLEEFALFNFSDNPTVAFNTGSAKSVH